MKTILQDEIETYIRGRLSPLDKELFESRMENDPFLRDAVDGFKMFPEVLPSKGIAKSNLAILTAITIVGLMWMGLWWLEQSLMNQYTIEPPTSAATVKEFNKELSELKSIEKKLATPILLSKPKAKSIGENSRIVNLKAIPLAAKEVFVRHAEFRSPEFRYRATFIHDLKVVCVDTTVNRDQNLLPEHLPARWESESHFLGSKKVYSPKIRQRHYMDYPLELFQRGRYEACLFQLNKVYKRLPGNLNLSFYRALCHYHLENYDAAIEQFKVTQNIIHPGFYEESKWYEALSQEKAGYTTQAKETYLEIVDQNGFYSIRAASRLAMLLQAE